MREIISLSVTSSTKAKLEKLALQLGRSKSDLVKQALNKFLFIEDLKQHRKKLIPYAEKKGYFTDEDIFNEF